MRLVLTLSWIAFLAAPWSAAEQHGTGAAEGIESLGRGLLDDLAPQVQPPVEKVRPERGMPDAHFDDLGEDIGQSSGPLPLVRAKQGMERVESLLAQRGAFASREQLGRAGTVQQEVVEQLDELIAQLSKQCQGGNCQPGDEPPKPSQPSQPKPGRPKSAAGRGQTAARDSTDRLDRASAQRIEKADIDAMVKQLWGHLPERSREQMLQTFSDDFLPKYELEIEQYYRSLSEENAGMPAD